MPSFVESGPPVPEKKIFEGFFTIYGHCGHLGHVSWIIYIYWFPLPIDASCKILNGENC